MPKERLFPELFVNPELNQPVADGEVLAVLIANRSGQMLLVKENHHSGKPWSVVTETISHDLGDKTVGDALIRGITEEVSPVIRDFRYLPGSHSQTGQMHYATAVYDAGSAYPFFSADPTEITGYAWVNREGLQALWQKNDLEPEVIPFVNQMSPKLAQQNIFL